ncbi:MAG TPA: O-antigen ligase family protein [Leptolinea sp.]
MRYLTRFQTNSASSLWAVLLVLLPITSTPFVRDLLHTSTVAGPSVLALVGLFLIWYIPFIWKAGKIPKAVLPLLGFVLVAILSISSAEFITIPTFKNSGVIQPAMNAFITLLVGLGYLLIANSRISNEQDYRKTLKWIYFGGLIMIIWSLLQSSVWFINERYPDWMRNLQDFLSLGPLYRQRATGFALEPSWQAHMLNMLYLPMWLSAVCSGYSVFSFRLFKKVTAEMLLLAMGLIVLGLTFSRVGWITFACMAAFLLILGNFNLVKWVQKRFHVSENRKKSSTIIITFCILLFYIGFMVFAAFGMSRIDPRMRDLFTRQFWQLNNMNRYANALQFGERVVYWQAGWEIFNRFPILGVGLGNAGKWFSETIPSYGMNLIEVRSLLYRSMDLPNIKNLWIRILAETGISGFAFFSAWLVSLWKKSAGLRSTQITICKMLGYWGIFVVIGIILEGFSIDSFAMPYFWISAGLVLSGGYFIKNSDATSTTLSLEES